jgi:hypothetical protein
MDEATGPFFQVAGVAKPFNISTLQKHTTLVRVPVSAFFFDMFYTHKHSNCTLTHPLFNYTFQKVSLLQGRAKNASDTDISVIFT